MSGLLWSVLTEEQASGKLFIQVPATATQERPAIRFKHTELAMPIEAHPLVSQIARPPSDSCSVQVSLSSAVCGHLHFRHECKSDY